jgi:hypothetical protein
MRPAITRSTGWSRTPGRCAPTRIKTYIIELGSSLVEIFAVGTAIRKQSGMTVKTQTLPAQAIIRDKDTWLSGSGGFDVTSIRAGG